MAVLVGTLLVGCGSNDQGSSSKAPTKKATVSPVTRCTTKVMRVVEAGFQDVKENAVNGTEGMTRVSALQMEIGMDDPYLSEALTDVLPQTAPLMPSQGEVSALSAAVDKSEAWCRGFVLSTD